MADSWTDCKKEQIFGITAQTDKGEVGLENTIALLRHRYTEIRSSCVLAACFEHDRLDAGPLMSLIIVSGGFPTGVQWALDVSSMGFRSLSPSAMWT